MRPCASGNAPTNNRARGAIRPQRLDVLLRPPVEFGESSEWAGDPLASDAIHFPHPLNVPLASPARPGLHVPLDRGEQFAEPQNQNRHSDHQGYERQQPHLIFELAHPAHLFFALTRKESDFIDIRQHFQHLPGNTASRQYVPAISCPVRCGARWAQFCTRTLQGARSCRPLL